MSYVNDIHDFEKNKDEAKKWAEERYSDWQERLLTRLEKEEIMDFMNNKEDAQQLNNYLEDTRGNIPETSEYRENIERLDKGLKRVKTEQAMFVYQRVSEQYFGHEVGSFREDSIKIDQTKFDEFKEKFIQNQGILKENGYMEASLSGISPNLAKEPCIYIRLKVPQGIHGGYTGNLQGTEGGTHDFLLNRGYGIQFTDAKIITEKGKQYIKVEAELLTKEKLDRKIKEYNQELNDSLDLTSQNLILLDLTGRFISSNYQKAQHIITTMKDIDKTLLEYYSLGTTEYSAEPNFKWVDYPVTHHRAFAHLKGKISNSGQPYDNLPGLHLTDPWGNHDTIVNLSKYKNQDLMLLISIHELGHAIDDLGLSNISKQKKFFEIYNEEKDSGIMDNTPSFKRNAQEYFAQCFAFYNLPHSDFHERLKVTAPKTYEFMSNLIYEAEQEKKLRIPNYITKVTFNFYNSTCNFNYNKK
ncbi:TPA: ADP-ribosyltransferase [Bacillus cereus]